MVIIPPKKIGKRLNPAWILMVIVIFGLAIGTFSRLIGWAERTWSQAKIAKIDTQYAKYDSDISSELAVIEASGQFALVVGLDGLGEPVGVDVPLILRAGNIYEVLVPESRRTSYFVRPTRCDAKMVVVEPFDYDVSVYPCSIEDWSRDRNRMVFRKDSGYTVCKFYPVDHQTNLPVVVKFKVVPDERVGQSCWQGRPMTPDELARYSGQRR